MTMMIPHVGRTGKETTITFNTETKTFCYGREKHDLFMYAEQTRDVRGVINDLKHLGYRELPILEFRAKLRAAGCETYE